MVLHYLYFGFVAIEFFSAGSYVLIPTDLKLVRIFLRAGQTENEYIELGSV